MINSEKEAKAREVYGRLRSECLGKVVQIEWTDDIKQKVLDIIAKNGQFKSEEYLLNEVFNPESTLYEGIGFSVDSIISKLESWCFITNVIHDEFNTLYWDEMAKLNPGWELADICSSEDEIELLISTKSWNKEDFFTDVCGDFYIDFEYAIYDNISPEELIEFLKKAWLDDEAV